MQSEGEKILLQMGKKPPYETLTNVEKRVIYLSVATGMFLAALDMNVVVVALPAIIKDLGQPELFTWIMASYMLTSSAVMVLYGRFSDVYGRRRVYLFAVGVFAIGSVLCGVATSLWFLVIARGFAGIGGGGLQSLGLTIVGDVTEPAKRPGIIAALSSIGALSSLLGPLIGGGLTDSSANGWRWIFYVNLPFCVLAFISSWIAMKRFELPVSNLPVDFLGSFLIASACICIVLFVLWGGAATGYPWDSGVIIGLIVASIVLLVLFIIQEKRHKLPIIELNMFKIRNVALIMPLIFFVGMQMFAGFTFLPVYFQSVLMDTALMSGVKLFPLVVTFLFGAFLASAILQKTGKIGFLVPIGAVFLTVGLGLFALIRPDTNYGDLAGFMILFGMGMGIIFALISVTLQNSVEASQMGVVMSAFAFFQLLGGSLGVAIVGALMNHWSEIAFIENPFDPLLALCKALDNVFLATIVPGGVVILLSLFVQTVKIKKEEGIELDLSGKERAIGAGEDSNTKNDNNSNSNNNDHNEAAVAPAPETPRSEVLKDPKVEQTLEEARSAIERKKSIIQQVSAAAKEEQEKARNLEERIRQQSLGERPRQQSNGQLQQQQQPMRLEVRVTTPTTPSRESRFESEGPATPKNRGEEEAPSDLQVVTETEEEMERRLREKQILVESQREQRAQKRRESEAISKAERAMSIV